MTIISRRNKNDITVQFEDGTIVSGTTVKRFTKNEIGNPNVSRIEAERKKKEGTSAIDSHGNRMILIEYKDSEHCRIRYEDGFEVQNKKYTDFINPNHIFQERASFETIRAKEERKRIAAEASNRITVGSTAFAKNGQEMKIIRIREGNRCDVMFEDGTIVKGKSISTFSKGKILNPNCMTPEQIHAKGYWQKYTTPFRCNNGLTAKLIEYRNRNDVDVQFEDGEISQHIRLEHIKRGSVKHPILKMYGFPYTYHGYKIEGRAFKIKGIQYYYVIKPNEEKDIMSPEQMLSNDEKQPRSQN